VWDIKRRLPAHAVSGDRKNNRIVVADIEQECRNRLVHLARDGPRRLLLPETRDVILFDRDRSAEYSSV
jgi:hypothetical protein